MCDGPRSEITKGISRRGAFAMLAAGASALAAPAAGADTPADDQRKARYCESEDVKRFYRVNRYPS